MESKQLEMQTAAVSIAGRLQVLDVGTEGVHHLQGDIDEGADAVGEEQEVAVGGHLITEEEVGGDPGCRGRAGGASRAATIGVCWLCLEIHAEIHPALSPAGPHCLAALGVGLGPPWQPPPHTQRWVAQEPWRSGVVRDLASPSSHHPRAGSSAGPGAGLGGPHTILGLGDPHNGWGWGTLTLSWGWGTFAPSWGCGTSYMGWGCGNRSMGYGLAPPCTLLCVT